MSGRATGPRRPASPPPSRPLSEREMDELQRLLDAVPAPLEPLDLSALDGFLCGVLVQPRPVPARDWLLHVSDGEGRRPPPGFDASRLHALVLRRHAELDQAIRRRQWFDPWIFELEPTADDEAAGGDDPAFPWVAGFAAAVELFPALMRLPGEALSGPLALLYRHLDPDDLDDADALLAEIELMEPPADLAESVEGLVRATLLLADAAGVEHLGRGVRS